jgi:hypothetical protein
MFSPIRTHACMHIFMVQSCCHCRCQTIQGIMDKSMKAACLFGAA